MSGSSPWSLPLLLLSILLCIMATCTPSLCTKINANPNEPKALGLQLALVHIDFQSKSPYPSVLQRVELAVARSRARKDRIEREVLHSKFGEEEEEKLQKTKRRKKRREKKRNKTRKRAAPAAPGVAAPPVPAATDTGYSASIVPGDGAFLTSFYLGTPPKRVTAIIDTGSDLVWQQCRPCMSCFDQADEIFDPAQSSTFTNATCSDTLCQSLHSNACINTMDPSSVSCTYTYSYGDTSPSSTSGWLAFDTLMLSSDGHGRVERFGFGCGNSNLGFESSSDHDGLLGMGQGPLSLASQISAQRFSYCLAPIMSSQESPLFLGDAAPTSLETTDKTSSIQVTKIITNKFSPAFYYINLTGISWNGTLLSIPTQTFALNINDGSGGMIIDSGTTITYLEDEGYQIVVDAITSTLKYKTVTSPIYGLDICYHSLQGKFIPSLTFHFEGANMDIPTSNLFLDIQGFSCLVLSSSNGISILGNMQQQNYNILYDRTNHKISFTHTTCGMDPTRN